MKSRVFEIVQAVKHPDTGEPLFDEEKIKKGLTHKMIKKYAYVLHDKDVDKNGKSVNPHWHVPIEVGSRPLDTAVIAKWFQVPENQVMVFKGAGAFLDRVEYITHESEEEQALGKYLYQDEAVTSNIDFRAELKKREENRLKYGKDLTPRERQRYDVMYRGKTLQQCRQEDPVLYMSEYKKLRDLRREYLSNLEPPNTRINYYVSGEGGIGKGLICKAIARSLFPELSEEEAYFEVGASNATFEGYDGQPIIIWNDFRAYDLLQTLGGRGNVFDVFESHPGRKRQNIKFDSIRLPNQINIINGPDDFREFLNGLVGEYTDKSGKLHKSENKSQSYRRFPIIIPLHEEDFDLLINKGFMNGTREFEQYIEYRQIRGNLQKIAAKCGANRELAHRLEAQTIKPITDKHKEIMETAQKMPEDEAAILEEFELYGKTPKEIEAIKKKKLEEYDKKNPYGLFEPERADILKIE